jgi:hypothetical protein
MSAVCVFKVYFTIIIETVLPDHTRSALSPKRTGSQQEEHGAFPGEKDKYTRSSEAGPLFKSTSRNARQTMA